MPCSIRSAATWRNARFAVLRPGGRAAFISGAAPVSPRPDVTALKPNVGRDRAHLFRIAERVTSGAVRVPEIKVYPLSEAAAAHRVSEGRHFRGKLVLKVR
jgi:NADPH:quinone reductase-like Zn-dependent oxidoreductase